jgi:uncharacterized protein YggE
VKKTWLAIIGLVVVVLGIVGLTGCGSEGTTLSGSIFNNQQTGIWVNGEGKISVVPDVAVLTLGIESQETSVADAQAKASEAMDKVIAALKAQGIKDKDIQTQYFNISQDRRWEDLKNTEVIYGYRVTNTVTVKVRNVEKAGEVIDVVVAAGGDLTRINGINFTVDEPAAYYVQARELALSHAAAKAQQMADKAGFKLGKITYVSESTNNYNFTYRNYYGMNDSAMAVPAPTIVAPVSVGSLELTADVQVAYEIK